MDGDCKTNFVCTREAVRISSLHPHTLRKYADKNEIRCYKTPAGQRMYHRLSLEEFCNSPSPKHQVPKSEKVNYLYSRVSSKKQLDDLTRQTNYLQSYRPEYTSYVPISDVASGVNFKRKGLQTILDSCLQGTIGEVVIAHRDRLCRFGFELLQVIIEKSGGKVTVLDNEGNKSTEQELAEDLLSIIHIYSCKQMGKRSYRAKLVENSENQIENQQETKGCIG